MTLDELYERIGWQREGRLQRLVTTPLAATGKSWWEDVPRDCDGLTPSVNCLAGNYRCRPVAAEMPDEVWLSDYPKRPSDTTMTAKAWACNCQGGTAVRYVRVGAVIDGARLQWRLAGCGTEWEDSSELKVEYRFRL